MYTYTHTHFMHISYVPRDKHTGNWRS